VVSRRFLRHDTADIDANCQRSALSRRTPLN
jgi:hypothetical protein